jgi:iron complex outermembrane recepter protein
VFSAQLRAQKVVEKSGIGKGSFRNGDTEGESLYLEDGITWNGNTSIPIFFDKGKGRLDASTLQGIVRADFATAAIDHVIRAGVSRNKGKDQFLSGNGDNRYPINDNSIDLFSPRNDQTVNFTGVEEFFGFVRGSDLKSVFGTWQAKWAPQFRTVFGLRRDTLDFFQFEKDEVTGEDSGRTTYGDKKLSFRLAGSYDINRNLSTFAGYSDAYQPQQGFTSAGERLESLHARSFETGFKLSLAGGKALWTNAIYQITQDNISACDTDQSLTPEQIDNCEFSIVFGNVRIRGVESELQGKLTDNLDLGAGLSLQDAKIIKSDAGFAGNRFSNTPRVQASTFASYTLAAFALPQLKPRAGVVHVGKRYGNSGNSIVLPAYTRLDLGASYALGKNASLDLSVENALDKTYYTAMQDNNSAAADQVAVGNRRLIQLNARLKF